MDIFNQHQEQLIREMNIQITKIDQLCTDLTKKIFLFSQERVRPIEEKHNTVQSEINSLKSEKTSNQNTKLHLINILKVLKQEQDGLKRELQEKQTQNSNLQREILFAEQKQKEEKPYLESFVRERKKSVKSNYENQYAKEKLKKLEKVFEKQSQEVQYKYRLVKLMKNKLKQLKIGQKTIGHKESKQTYDSFHNQNHLDHLQYLTALPKYTEQSEMEQSRESELIC